jgi:NADH dehydrogenase
MLARIYKPARSAMQSGEARTREWVLEFVPADAKVLDPLMGWTGSGDMNRQVRLRFDSREAAVAYAERHGIPHQVFEPKPRHLVVRQNGYGDNFASGRRFAWTH